MNPRKKNTCAPSRRARYTRQHMATHQSVQWNTLVVVPATIRQTAKQTHENYAETTNNEKKKTLCGSHIAASLRLARKWARASPKKIFSRVELVVNVADCI